MKRNSFHSYRKVTGIYGIQHKASKRIYVGRAFDIGGKRLPEHVYLLSSGKHSNSYLQSAWIKYGCEEFDFIILRNLTHDIKGLSKEEVDDLLFLQEKQEFQLHDKVYNLCTPGKNSGLGRCTPEEVKEKQRQKACVNWKDPLQHEKQSGAIRKGIQTESYREVMSAVMKEHFKSLEAKRVASEGQKKRYAKLSEKKKRSCSQKLLWKDPIYRETQKRLQLLGKQSKHK